MLRVISSAVGLALLGLASPAMAQGVGPLQYVEQSVESLQSEFNSISISRTRDYRIHSLNDDHYRDHTFQLSDPGYIAVGGDTDTQWLTLSMLENGQPASWNRDSGQRSANIYFSRAGTYTVRVYIQDCSESYCVYSIMAGYR